MTNVRPKQIKPVNWPWTNRFMNGHPIVDNRDPNPWIPDLVSCFDWDHIEEEEFPCQVDGVCTRDMKSVYTTTVRMYGLEEVYLRLEAGQNPFMPIAAVFADWLHALSNAVEFDTILVGDDLGHNTGLFLPPRHMGPLDEAYIYMLKKFTGHTLILHSDGKIEEAKEIIYMNNGVTWWDHYLIQKELNPTLTGHEFLDHKDVTMDRVNYAVKEEK